MEYIDEIDELIDGHSALFADYLADGEQQLEWTELHNRYVRRAESNLERVHSHLGRLSSHVPPFAHINFARFRAPQVALVEQGIAETLEELECSAEEIFDYAKAYGGDPAADRFLTKLLAQSDYGTFCAMMQQAHIRGPMSV